MSSIPMDIILTNILPRLPAKSLVRFKCVCKSWQTYISTPEFIFLHFHRSFNSFSNSLLILSSSDNSLYSFSLHIPQIPPTKLHLPPVCDAEPCVVGSCFGLLCVQLCSPSCDFLLVVNPLTGICRKVPSQRLPRRPIAINFGFGFDHVKEDYKVVRMLDYYTRGIIRQMSRQVSVFSLKANAWQMVEWVSATDSMRNHENGTLLNNHLLHWNVWCFVQGKYRIRRFDLCQDNWTDDVPLPDCDDKRESVLDFGVFEGCLYLSTKNEQQTVDNIAVDVWAMKEYGAKESWVKLFSISDTRVTRSLRIAPVAYGDGEHEILVRRHYKAEQKLIWFNVAEETVADAEFCGIADWDWVDVCRGSLVNVPGGCDFVKI